MPHDDWHIDLHAVHEVLRTERATETWLQSWLPATWNDPMRWKRSLYAAVAEQRGGAVKGRPGEGFDFYHDCLLAQVGRRRMAMVALDDRDLVQVSFETLHERSSALANAWRAAGVEPGECLAVVLPVGVDYAVAILAALRLGLVVTPLPPIGRTYVRGNIARLKPDRVVSLGRHQKTLPPGTEVLSMSVGSADASLAASHLYADDEAALRLLSPFGDGEAEAVDVSAATLHEALLRDAMLVFALDPGDRVAAPGFEPLQLQPLAMLTAWVVGAAWVEFEPQDLEADPRLVAKAGVTTMGISRPVRELVLRKAGEGIQPATSFFRAINDVYDFDRWDQLARVLAVRKIPGFTVLTNAASGGAHLFAPRSLELAPMRAWPVPGRVFQLSRVGAGTLPALGESGTYTPMLGKEPDLSLLQMVMAKLGEGWTLGGSIAGGPEGHTVPVREIAAAAELHPGVRAAAVVVAPGRWMNDAHVILLLFVEPGTSDSERPSVAEVKRLVQQEMGARHLPQRVDTYALRPRFVEAAVDLAWCRSQYLSGTLASKARSPLFAASARLGWIFGVPPRTP